MSLDEVVAKEKNDKFPTSINSAHPLNEQIEAAQRLVKKDSNSFRNVIQPITDVPVTLLSNDNKISRHIEDIIPLYIQEYEERLSYLQTELQKELLSLQKSTNQPDYVQKRLQTILVEDVVNILTSAIDDVYDQNYFEIGLSLSQVEFLVEELEQKIPSNSYLSDCLLEYIDLQLTEMSFFLNDESINITNLLDRADSIKDTIQKYKLNKKYRSMPYDVITESDSLIKIATENAHNSLRVLQEMVYTESKFEEQQRILREGLKYISEHFSNERRIEEINRIINQFIERTLDPIGQAFLDINAEELSVNVHKVVPCNL